MTRNEAIDLLARHELAELGVEERESMLLDWWPVDEDDSGWASLSDAIRAEMKQGDLPQDAGDPKHDPLLCLAIRHSFVGVANTGCGWAAETRLRRPLDDEEHEPQSRTLHWSSSEELRDVLGALAGGGCGVVGVDGVAQIAPNSLGERGFGRQSVAVLPRPISDTGTC